jgi:actin related protein 2/3 complex subunit 3
VKGAGDRTLIYLTLFAAMCLVKAEKFDDKPSFLREMKQAAAKPFAIPGEANFPLTGLFPAPENKSDGGN